MRPIRLGVALLATSGLAGCTSALPGSEADAPLPLAEAVRGAWVSADSVSVTRRLEDEGAEASDSSVRWTFVYLNRHIEVGDSVATISSVWKNVVEFVEPDLDTTHSVPFGQRWTYPVRLDGGRVWIGERSELILLSEDRLGVVTTHSDSEIDTVVYRRGQSLGLPAALAGTWVGDVQGNASGAPRRIYMRFTDANTVVVSGRGERPAVALGSYLLLGEPSPEQDYGGSVTYYNAAPFNPAIRYRLRGDRLSLEVEGQSVTLHRRSE